MDNIPIQKLSELLRVHGDQLYEDPARLEGLLLDLCGSPYRLEVTALIKVFRAGIVADLRKYPSDRIPGPVVDAFETKLSKELDLPPDRAHWSIAAWARVLGKTVPVRPAHVPAKTVPAKPKQAVATPNGSSHSPLVTKLVSVFVPVALGAAAMYLWNSLSRQPQTIVLGPSTTPVSLANSSPPPQAVPAQTPTAVLPSSEQTASSEPSRFESEKVLKELALVKGELERMKFLQQNPPRVTEPAPVDTPRPPPPTPPHEEPVLPAGFDDFFKEVWAHQSSNDPSVWAGDFASSSDYPYKEDGLASRTFVETDRRKLINMYSNRSYTLGVVETPQIISPTEVRLSYSYRYSYRGQKVASGTSLVSFTANLINGRWQITRMRENVRRN